MKKTLDTSQMIELKKLGYVKDDSLAGLIEFLGTAWMVSNRNSIGEWEVERRDGMEIFINEELCDALWEAVKECLK